MRVLVIQNYAGTGLGQVGAALREAGARVDLRRADLGEAVPAFSANHDALVVLGGGQNALDDAGSPWFANLLALMRDFGDSGRAVLGICLGSQLLARAYGGENRVGAAKEFGWQEVDLTAEGLADPVLAAAPACFRIFQWHDDTFSLPRGAVRLAGNAVAENQAFRVGRAAYGVQFHFEADTALIREWNGVFKDELAERQPGWADRFEGEATIHGAGADAAGMALARAWVAAISARTASAA